MHAALPTTHAQRFSFCVPGDLRYRDAVRAFFTSVCTVHFDDTSEALLHQLVSAFVEAFNNSVIHGYARGRPGPIEIELELSSTDIKLSVRDYGAPFEFDHVPAPELDALPESGMGLYIIRGFMDEVKYERTASANILRMTRVLKPASQEKGTSC